MDGKTIASPTISVKIDSSSVNIENNFTEQVAENYALLLNAGALPVTLTVSSAPAANDKPIDGDDNNGGTTTEPTSPTTPTNPDTSDTTEFPDMKGHWAEAALKKGITLGLLKGSNGKMLPNDPVRGSEALTILNRALGASEQDSTASLAASQQLDSVSKLYRRNFLYLRNVSLKYSQLVLIVLLDILENGLEHCDLHFHNVIHTVDIAHFKVKTDILVDMT